MKKVTTKSWCIESSLIHNNKYDYSESIYTKSSNKIKIICPIHGEFEQIAAEHVRGRGCLKCGRVKHEKSRRSTTETFIQKSNMIHKFLYDYSKAEYINARTNVCIVCKKHGEFWQNPNNHINGQGCPICKYSAGEQLIYNWLVNNSIKFVHQKEIEIHKIARNTNKVIVDFFVKHNNQQYFIEYDGKQHFEYVPYFHRGGVIDFEKQINRDKMLEEFCNIHKDKVTLIRFNHMQTEQEILNNLKNKLNNTWIPF